MDTDYISHTFKSVCEAPAGKNFIVDYLPDFLHKGAIDDSTPHVHTFYEILWFQGGEGIHTVDFQEYRVKPNSIFFITPGQVHNFDDYPNYQGVSIKFCTDIMNEEYGKSNLFLKYNVFHTYDTTPYFIIDDATAADLKVLVQNMEKEIATAQTFGHVDILRALLRIFLVKVYRDGKQEGELHLDDLKPSHRLFVTFRKAVESDFRTLHTVQDYAYRLNVSVRTLNKSVNECSGKSPLAFINDRIMLEAKRQIRYTDMMIKEIAYNLGYDDPSYFIKFFKRQTGYIPSDFRELDKVCACVPEEV